MLWHPLGSSGVDVLGCGMHCDMCNLRGASLRVVGDVGLAAGKQTLSRHWASNAGWEAVHCVFKKVSRGGERGARAAGCS